MSGAGGPRRRFLGGASGVRASAAAEELARAHELAVQAIEDEPWERWW